MSFRATSLIAFSLIALKSLGQTSSSDSQALHFNGGFVCGLTLSQIHGDGVGGFNKLGFNAGVTVQVLNNADKGVHLSVIYNQKGSRKPRDTNIEGDDTWAYRFTYIDIPVVYTVPIDNIHLEFGLQPSVLVAAEENFWGVSFEPTTIDDLKNFDLSAVLGAQIKMNKGSRFYTRLTQSIIPITPMPESPGNRWDKRMRNMTLEMGVIVLFFAGD